MNAEYTRVLANAATSDTGFQTICLRKVVRSERVLSQMADRMDDNSLSTDFKNRAMGFAAANAVSQFANIERHAALFGSERPAFWIPR